MPKRRRSKQDRSTDNLFHGRTITVPTRFILTPTSHGRRRRARAGRAALLARRAPDFQEKEVLVAEIPRGKRRWHQANFKKEDFVRFLLVSGPGRRLSLWNVRMDGSLEEHPENRLKVSVKSKNFRIELGAGAGRGYPKRGRPIGVFVRTAPGDFIYMLIMPRGPHYRTAKKILDKYATPPPNQLRRVRGPLEQLRREWPASPLWKHINAFKDSK